MRPRKLKSVRYSSAITCQRHVIISVDSSDQQQREALLLIRDWVNYASGSIRETIESLCSLVGDAPRFVVRFSHSQVNNTLSQTTWTSIFQNATEDQSANVRILIRFSKPQKFAEDQPAILTCIPSHMLGVQIGAEFRIEDARGICNLAVELPLNRQAFTNFLVDIIADIFLFHHFAAISLGSGSRSVSLGPDVLRGISEDKLRFAERLQYKYYGSELRTGGLAAATYVSFAGCHRIGIFDSGGDKKALVHTWECFFDEQFPKISLSLEGKRHNPEQIATALADSLLSLTKIGGQISRKNVMKQLTDYLAQGSRDLVFVFVHRNPPEHLRKSVKSLMGRTCRPGRHSVLSMKDFPAAAQLAPYIIPIRLYRRPNPVKSAIKNG